MGHGSGHSTLTRRGFLAFAAPAIVTATSLSGIARAAVPKDRRLSLLNLHTGEKLTTVYFAEGDYQQAGLAEINHILRDWRSGEVYPMEVGLIDMLHGLHQRMESGAPFHIISGYRSPKTNAKLRSKSNGVAKRSLHMRGMAADISLPDRDLDALRETAIGMKAGGVGIYRKSGFVHVDTGRVRFW